jgi:hypothetical protein
VGKLDWVDDIQVRLILTGKPYPWHAGRQVGRTIYCGDGPDDLIGIMDTRELADFVAHAPEDIGRLIAEVRKLRDT